MTTTAPGGAPRRRTARAVSDARAQRRRSAGAGPGRRSRAAALAAGLAGAAFLAACQTTAPASLGLHEWRSIPPGALAAMSADGPFEGVEGRERRTPLEIHQQMALVNETTVPGQNEIVLTADVAGFWADRQGVPRLGDYAFSGPEVRRMIVEAFEGAADVREPSLRRNAYGPFYAVEAFYPGRANCVLAWQVLDNREGGHPIGARRVTTRYRMCDPAKSTAELLADFEGLRLAL